MMTASDYRAQIQRIIWQYWKDTGVTYQQAFDTMLDRAALRDVMIERQGDCWKEVIVDVEHD